MSVFLRGDVWWYEFWFAGRRIRESSKSSSKTLAKTAEQKRKRELEEGFNNVADTRQSRIKTLSELSTDYLESYRLRHPRSATFGEYAVRHIIKNMGTLMFVDCNEAAIMSYQNGRLSEGAAPKTINDEVGFLLRILGDHGDVLRLRLKKRKLLKLKIGKPIGKAYTEDEKDRMLAVARTARSSHIYMAIVLSQNAGLRDGELKQLTWARVNREKRYLTVGESKTEAGEGRTIPLNSTLLDALSEYSEWYEAVFGTIEPEWYLFPYGKPRPNDPTRPVTTLKTAWNNVRTKANVKGRWHDHRHTLITDLAESGAGNQTIMDIAGHVSQTMLKHYSHIRMQAKREALESLVKKPSAKESVSR